MYKPLLQAAFLQDRFPESDSAVRYAGYCFPSGYPGVFHRVQLRQVFPAVLTEKGQRKYNYNHGAGIPGLCSSY